MSLEIYSDEVFGIPIARGSCEKRRASSGHGGLDMSGVVSGLDVSL